MSMIEQHRLPAGFKPLQYLPSITRAALSTGGRAKSNVLSFRIPIYGLTPF
jgi:hypothetical protein